MRWEADETSSINIRIRRYLIPFQKLLILSLITLHHLILIPSITVSSSHSISLSVSILSVLCFVCISYSFHSPFVSDCSMYPAVSQFSSLSIASSNNDEMEIRFHSCRSHLPRISLGMSEEEQATILQPVGYSSSRCGYCVSTSGHKKTGKPSKSYGIWAHSLSPTISAELLLLGWRRSGKYLYKPDQRSTCCQQFTISLRAEEFRSTKSQRNALKAFANYIVFGAGVKEGTRGWGIAREGLEEVGEESKERGKASTSKLESRDEGKEKDERPKKGAKGEGKQKTLSEAIHEPEWINSPTSKPFAHKFEVGQISSNPRTTLTSDPSTLSSQHRSQRRNTRCSSCIKRKLIIKHRTKSLGRDSRDS